MTTWRSTFYKIPDMFRVCSYVVSWFFTPCLGGAIRELNRNEAERSQYKRFRKVA